MSSDNEPANPGRRRALGAAAVGVAVGAAAGMTGGVAIASSTTPVPAPVINGLRRFENKTVLITGATSGIGRAAAKAFAREGAKVAFCGRREVLGREVEQEIKAAGGQARYIKADVRVESEVENLVAQTLRTYGRLDIALNNAGISFQSPLHQTSTAEWDNLQATNVRGVFLCMKAQIPHMLERGGQILVTSSVNVAAARPELGAYNASKRALAGIIQTAALEYADRNIRVNGICPGATDTEMIRRQAGMMGAPDAVWHAGVGAWANSNVHGLKRVANADEIATAILAVASPEMGYMNGSLVFIDGGMTAAL